MLEKIWTNQHWANLGGKTYDWTELHHYLKTYSGPLDLINDSVIVCYWFEEVLSWMKYITTIYTRFLPDSHNKFVLKLFCLTISDDVVPAVTPIRGTNFGKIRNNRHLDIQIGWAYSRTSKST